MLPRVIPCLLLRGSGLVKTVRFANPKYVGDLLNTAKLFSDKEADEVILLDISATAEGKGPQFELIEAFATECFMPVAYGGGIRTLGEIEVLFRLGIEKVCLNTAAVREPKLVSAAARNFGCQSIVVVIDAKKKRTGGYDCTTHSGRQPAGEDPVTMARRAEQLGAGEIVISAVDRDGTMAGYDLDLVGSVTAAVSIPVVALGGAGSLDHIREVVAEAGASAAAAGSLFIYQGVHKAVLISFPQYRELQDLFGNTHEYTSGCRAR